MKHKLYVYLLLQKNGYRKLKGEKINFIFITDFKQAI